MHLGVSMLGFRSLNVSEKLAVCRAMAAILRAGRPGREALAQTPFSEWLRRQGQPERAIRRFWANVVISACNEPPERTSCRYAMQVFQEGFLAHPHAYRIGVSGVPLSELYDAAESVIHAGGGRVLMGQGASRFVYDEHHRRVTGLELTDGTRLEADAFISAVPFDRFVKLCGETGGPLSQADERPGQAGRLEVSPILGVHLWFGPSSEHDQPLMKLPHAALLDSPLQWVFNKGQDPKTGHWHLHGVISAAHEWVDQSADEIAKMAQREARRYLPGLSGAPLLRHRVIKEKRATFSPLPGVDADRPGARGAVANLYTAGDWCDSGWPATMEGAVRSGHLAADAAWEDLGQSVLGGVSDLPPSRLYRWLSRG
jgi:zeta-carotene desaturase